MFLIGLEFGLHHRISKMEPEEIPAGKRRNHFLASKWYFSGRICPVA